MLIPSDLICLSDLEFKGLALEFLSPYAEAPLYPLIHVNVYSSNLNKAQRGQ